MKDGIPFLIKAAQMGQSPHKTQEFAIVALGEIGGQESIEPLLVLSRNSGSTCQRDAKEAVTKIRSRAH